MPLFLGHGKIVARYSCVPNSLMPTGIGSFLHGPPDIYHCLNNYPLKMVPGMVFTIEPVIAEGDWRASHVVSSDRYNLHTISGADSG